MLRHLCFEMTLASAMHLVQMTVGVMERSALSVNALSPWNDCVRGRVGVALRLPAAKSQGCAGAGNRDE